jgi:hypothetical protein
VPAKPKTYLYKWIQMGVFHGVSIFQARTLDSYKWLRAREHPPTHFTRWQSLNFAAMSFSRHPGIHDAVLSCDQLDCISSTLMDKLEAASQVRSLFKAMLPGIPGIPGIPGLVRDLGLARVFLRLKISSL